jgi:ABC-type amino acid transport system permease subunit
MSLAAGPVTWIKADRPTFDLVGLIVGSIGLTLVLAVIALALGLLLGLAIIHRRRNEPGWAEQVSLKLGG